MAETPPADGPRHETGKTAEHPAGRNNFAPRDPGAFPAPSAAPLQPLSRHCHARAVAWVDAPGRGVRDRQDRALSRTGGEDPGGRAETKGGYQRRANRTNRVARDSPEGRRPAVARGMALRAPATFERKGRTA